MARLLAAVGLIKAVLVSRADAMRFDTKTEVVELQHPFGGYADSEPRPRPFPCPLAQSNSKQSETPYAIRQAQASCQKMLLLFYQLP